MFRSASLGLKASVSEQIDHDGELLGGKCFIHVENTTENENFKLKICSINLDPLFLRCSFLVLINAEFRVEMSH